MSNPSIHKKKAALLRLQDFKDQKIIVSFSRGADLHGVLKGYDSNMNLVMADTEEVTEIDGEIVRRLLGPAIVRGTSVTFVSPFKTTTRIDNPFEGS